MVTQNSVTRSQPLRATNGWSITGGMPERKPAVERGIAALLSLLTRPRRPPDLPDYLRSDVGLPPIERSKSVLPISPYLPDPLKYDRW